MKRVSFFVHDLRNNPIVRAVPLAQALEGRYEVEILGFLHGEGDVYAPYRNAFPTRTLRCPLDIGAVARALPDLARLATGDIVFACKPLLPTLGAGLLASGWGRRKPLLLDAEDDELVPMGQTWRDVLWRDVIKGWRHATAVKYTLATHLAVPLASAVTVSSTRLQRRYGGLLLRHGPDERIFNPATAPDGAAARRALGLPAEVPVLLFAGMPQPHKGFDVLRRALGTPGGRAWHLALAGPREHPEFQRCLAELPGRCHDLGLLPQARMPEALAAVDAVPVPQRRVRFAESQLPAKALEAMAMSRPVVASRVADLPEILGEGARGWLVDPDDPEALGAALGAMAAQPDERRRRGLAARAWYLDHASRAAIAARLVPLLDGLAVGV